MARNCDISALLGATISEITGLEVGSESVRFLLTDGRVFCMYHEEACCESVSVNEIVGDPAFLLNSTILQAREDTNECADPKPNDDAESWTWTFYNLATQKGYVTIRWLGESNGYYSETVEFVEES